MKAKVGSHRGEAFFYASHSQRQLQLGEIGVLEISFACSVRCIMVFNNSSPQFRSFLTSLRVLCTDPASLGLKFELRNIGASAT